MADATARPKRRLGQNFLICRSTAQKEAALAAGKSAIELGPGRGMLTHELCKTAKRVAAVEIDSGLYTGLEESCTEANLQLVNADFFTMDRRELAGYDILVANIPYNLSSRTLTWLFEGRMEAVLCIQKEFAEHMLAKPSTRKYSRLSVFTSLFFDVRKVCRVPASCFYPKPRVDSIVVHMLPKGTSAAKEELDALALLMEHKKRKVRNALMDAHSQFGITAAHAKALSERLPDKDSRVFKLPPVGLLGLSREIVRLLAQKLE